MASAGMFAYISGSAYVFVEMFGVSEKQYGWLFGLNATGLILASQLNGRMLRRTTSQEIIKTVSLVQIIAAFTMFCLSFSGVLNIYSTLFVLFFYMFAQGFLFPNSSALAMAPFSKRAGIASALLGSFQMMFSAVASFAVSFFHNNTAVPMTAIILFCASCSFILIRVGQHHMKNSSSLV
jgi:DHA1 family bicyclomycin/chloramphenicol resistance-like MFS transporter